MTSMWSHLITTCEYHGIAWRCLFQWLVDQHLWWSSITWSLPLQWRTMISASVASILSDCCENGRGFAFKRFKWASKLILVISISHMVTCIISSILAIICIWKTEVYIAAVKILLFVTVLMLPQNSDNVWHCFECSISNQWFLYHSETINEQKVMPKSYLVMLSLLASTEPLRTRLTSVVKPPCSAAFYMYFFFFLPCLLFLETSGDHGYAVDKVSDGKTGAQASQGTHIFVDIYVQDSM